MTESTENWSWPSPEDLLWWSIDECGPSEDPDYVEWERAQMIEAIRRDPASGPLDELLFQWDAPWHWCLKDQPSPLSELDAEWQAAGPERRGILLLRAVRSSERATPVELCLRVLGCDAVLSGPYDDRERPCNVHTFGDIAEMMLGQSASYGPGGAWA
jgi:hypothetical protein